MISGAPRSISRLRRLLRLITRRYRSLRSLVAKRPPSSCTIGRRSGGITGRIVRIIHSGLERERRNRSEEHTSELQSHVNLVCRLLLEKKKKTQVSALNARGSKGS